MPSLAETALQGKDRQLALAAGQGDQMAFVELARKYRPEITKVVSAELGGAPGSENAVRDVFSYARLRVDALKDPTRFSAWLVEIAGHVARSYR